jgi:UDP-N-acetylmuramate--alanine ligase
LNFGFHLTFIIDTLINESKINELISMDISKMNNVYMIGIKGVGMTMLAQFLAQKGVKISGSDIEEKFMTDDILAQNGIKVLEGFSLKNIPSDAELIIYSTAYSAETNPEVKEIMRKDFKILTFGEALSKIFNVSRGLAVCGTHGKTTTTAWLGYVLDKAGEEPNVMVGAKVEQFGGSGLTGESDLLVVEADEYQNKLKSFFPKAVILNNIEHDHHDFFPTRESYISVFRDFIKKIPSKGFLVANYDDPEVKKISSECSGKVVSFGIDDKEADLVACGIKQGSETTGEAGKQFFQVEMVQDGERNELGAFNIQLSGKHNIYNALAVIASCLELGVDLKDIRTYLEGFTGAKRRMQVLGYFRQVPIIDDYAHHPTEIRTTLTGVKNKFPGKRLITVFHPHTYSRTLALLEEFGQSFGQSDQVIVLDIYGSAREKQGGIHSRDLVEKIKENSFGEKKENILYIPTLKECEEYLREHVNEGDLVLLMGAGDVFRIGENMVEN